MEKRNKRLFVTVAAFVPAILFLLLPLYRPAQLPVFFLFLGRFHPLVLHFPIVLIIMALLFEVAGQFRYLKKARRIVGIVLIAAVISSFIAVVAGFLLFSSGDYSGQLIERHFWAGAITGAAISATTATFFLCRNSPQFYPVYFTGLILSNLVMGYASHIGGTITHGRDFLTDYIPALLDDPGTATTKPESEMLVYDDILAPMFEFKCAGCHNPARTKGELVLTSYQSLFKAGKSGKPAIIPGEFRKSELLNRVVLPESHEDHMPPEGKTPMTPEEISLLRYWIQSGASQNVLVSQAEISDTVAGFVQKILPKLSRYRRKAGLARMKKEELRKEMDEVALRLAVEIRWDSLADDERFMLSMKFPPGRFSGEHVKDLMPYAEYFSRISMVASAIDDETLYYVGQMPNLKALYLQKTSLDGSGLVHLQALSNLEILNLSFTKVDDKAAIDLLRIPNLRQVYLYRAKTSREVIEALMKNKPGLQILDEEGPYD